MEEPDQNDRERREGDLSGEHLEAGDLIKVAPREQLGREELAEDGERRRVERHDAQVAEGEEPAADHRVMPAGGPVGVGELGPRHRKGADHAAVAPGDHDHRQPAERDAERRAERPGGPEEVAGEDEAAEADDAAERQRPDLERREYRPEPGALARELVRQCHVHQGSARWRGLSGSPAGSRWPLHPRARRVAGMKVSRRTLLRSALVPGTLAWAANARAETQAAIRHSSFDPWIEIRPDHVRHNVREVSRLVEGRPILAVIKNNAYGMGLLNMARILESEAAVIGMAVVKLSEALELRDAGIAKPVLLMGPFDDAGLEAAVMRDVTPMVYTEVGDALDRLAARRQAAVPVQVCVDTGMGRVGISHRRAAGLIADLAGRDGVDLTGHDDHAQRGPRVREAAAPAVPGGRRITRRNAGSPWAGGTRRRATACSTTRRPTSMRSGPAWRSSASTRPRGSARLDLLDLRPSMSLKARVALVKKLEPGDTAGYEAAYRADRDVWIATVPAGHVDGVPRVAANGGWVKIRETRYPIIASVSASHTIVEVGPEKTVEAGDVATYFDWREGSRPEDASAASGASVYDLVMHLNPTLPRRLVA